MQDVGRTDNHSHLYIFLAVWPLSERWKASIPGKKPAVAAPIIGPAEFREGPTGYPRTSLEANSVDLTLDFVMLRQFTISLYYYRQSRPEPRAPGILLMYKLVANLGFLNPHNISTFTVRAVLGTTPYTCLYDAPECLTPGWKHSGMSYDGVRAKFWITPCKNGIKFVRICDRIPRYFRYWQLTKVQIFGNGVQGLCCVVLTDDLSAEGVHDFGLSSAQCKTTDYRSML